MRPRSDMLSRLKGIETLIFLLAFYSGIDSSDMLSRLKGIETFRMTEWQAGLLRSDMLSRLKGIETRCHSDMSAVAGNRVQICFPV